MKTRLSEIMPFLENECIISYEDNTDFNITEINNYAKSHPNDDIVVEIPNTKGITSSMLKRLEDNVLIRIAGAYDYERMNAQKNNNFRTKKGTKKSALEYYYLSVVYKKIEAVKILERIEKIEENINSNWSDIQKLIYLYTTIKRRITYDPKYKEKTDRELRTLRGLINKNTVCAGYSLILKEFLDRQNIKCMWVGGKGHAWNIVEIEGKLYPIDLTYENKKYRDGIEDSYMFLGQNVEEFNEQHTPADNDPNNGYQEKLCELDKNLLEYIYPTVIKEEDFEKTSFRCERDNKEEFILVQIGRKEINNETYYMYYYDKIDSNNVLANNPLILSSKENICKYVDNNNFNKENTLTNNDICNKLFTEENIKDSLNNHSLYVGGFKKYKGTKGYINQLKKEEKDLRLFNIPPKVYPRNDGSIFTVEKDSIEPLQLDNNYVYKYNIYDITYEENKPILRKRIIYTDIDFIYSNKEEIQTKLLTEENITKSIKNNCGYIGYINKSNELEYNSELLSFFNKKNNITINDFNSIDKHNK